MTTRIMRSTRTTGTNKDNEGKEDKEEKNSKIPERLSGVTLEQANKAVASHSMGD